MEIIDQLLVRRRSGDKPPAVIQLLAGDLAALPPVHAVDVLVVSAFRDDYEPVERTLFQALGRRGLDMREVAQQKAEDKRDHLGCWLSKPLPLETVKRFHFKRILCFEPNNRLFLEKWSLKPDSIKDMAGFVFRGLNHFILSKDHGQPTYKISSVALPLLATGNQGAPVEKMFPHLLDEAALWMEGGLRLDQLKIVAFGEPATALARRIFAAKVRENAATSACAGTSPTMTVPVEKPDWKMRLAEAVSREVIDTCKRNLRRSLTEAADRDERKVLDRLFHRVDELSASGCEGGWAAAERFDVFVSYAHKDVTEVREFVKALRLIKPPPSVFFDEVSIRGDEWLKKISTAVENTRIFVAVLSPAYEVSDACWKEFQYAEAMMEVSDEFVIRHVLWSGKFKDFTPAFRIRSHIKCTKRNPQALRAAATTVME